METCGISGAIASGLIPLALLGEEGGSAPAEATAADGTYYCKELLLDYGLSSGITMFLEKYPSTCYPIPSTNDSLIASS